MLCVPFLETKSPSVLEALQEIYLYLPALNLPALPLHTDRSRAFMNTATRNTRKWFANQLVRVTTTEGDAPAQNSSAERAIRWLKTRARTLLRSADFPPSLWECAMRAAAAQQRSEVVRRACSAFWCQVHGAHEGLHVCCSCEG